MSETFNIEEARARFEQIKSIFDYDQIGRRLAFIAAHQLSIKGISTPNDLHSLPKETRVILGTLVAQYLGSEKTDEISHEEIAIMSWQKTQDIQR